MGEFDRRDLPTTTVRRIPWGGRGRPKLTPDRVIPLGQPTVVEHTGIRWINIECPTAASVEYLRQHFDFHEPDLEDVLDTLQQPKCDEYDDYLSLVLQFPIHSKLTRTTASTEVDIFVGRDYVITLHDTRLKPLVRLFDMMEREPEQIDEMIFDRNSLRTIEEIATARRDIIATRRIIKPQVQIINQLDRRVRLFFKQRGEEEEELEAYFGDLVDKVAKIYDLLDDAKEVVDALSATTDSLTSHRLNEVIKILTIFSVIMLPLTLISSIYGMNVPLPQQEHPLSFTFLMLFMVLISAAMVLFFRWRRWL